MSYKLVSVDKNNNKYNFYYDPYLNSFKTEEGTILNYHYNKDRNNVQQKYQIRIILGKRCNVNCSYCIQDKHITDPELKSDFVEQLDRVFGINNIGVIKFWGGEPLFYFDKLVQIYNEFKKYDKDNHIVYTACTNGVRFKEKEIRDWVDSKPDFVFAISNDGPGHALRNYDDPFDNKDIINFFKRNMKLKKHLSQHKVFMAINPMLTRLNTDLYKYNLWIQNKFQSNELPNICSARPIVITDESFIKMSMPLDFLPTFIKTQTYNLITGKINNWIYGHDEINYILSSLNTPLDFRGKCFVDNPYIVIMDTEGDIIPCMNFKKTDKDQYGNSLLLNRLYEMNDASELKKTNMIRLEEKLKTICRDCVVYRVCRGYCSYTPIKFDELNCHYYKAQSIPILGAVLYKLTGTLLNKIIKL